jgi:hypothetical protein
MPASYYRISAKVVPGEPILRVLRRRPGCIRPWSDQEQHHHSAFQTCTVISLEAEAIRDPSGDQASENTILLWPR